MYPAPPVHPPYPQPYNGYAPPYNAPPHAGYAQPHYLPAAAPVYGEQPYQQRRPAPAPAHNGPPFKKQKGNPVITRYAPPPGYNPAPSYSTNPYGAPPYAVPQEYQAAAQPAHPQTVYQGYQQPAPAYPSAATYPPQPSYDPNQAYQQPPYQPLQTVHPYPSQPYAAPASAPTPSPAYPPQEQAGHYDANGMYVVPVPHSTPSAHSIVPYVEAPIYAVSQSEDGYAASHTRHSSVDLGLDLDFESEVGTAPEDIQQELSLGLIVWHPAEPTKEPLPSVFDDASPEWLASAKATEGEHKCNSRYFSGKSANEVISVRQTAEWEEAQNDLIFVEFGKTCETVTLLAVVANRDRPDLSTEQLEPVTYDDEAHLPSHITKQLGQTQESHLADNVQGDDDQSDGDQAMDMSDDDDEPSVVVTKPVLQPPTRSEVQGPPPLRKVSIVESLEQVTNPRERWNPERQPQRFPARHSRSRSPNKRSKSPEKRSSRQGSQQPKAKPAPHPRDATQESVLAALGVEGSPKLVYPTPPPALGPPGPPSNRNRIMSPGTFDPPNNGMHQHFPYGPNLPPPPPPRENRSPSYDPWRGHGGDSPRSVASQHTLPGSDFHPEHDDYDMDATPKAKAPTTLERSGSGRKRTFDEVAAGDGRRRQEEDTPRARRRQQSRTDVYSRYRR